MDRFVTVHRTNVHRPTKRILCKLAKEESFCQLRRAIIDGTNEECVDVTHFEDKGRGVVARKRFEKDDFIVEYKGELIGSGQARVRECLYAQDESIGSYMYYFKHNGKSYCVDATKETKWKGRLVNHSYLNPNARTKVVDFGGSFHLILVALRTIDVGEEVLYDYGDRSPVTVAKNPWLLDS